MKLQIYTHLVSSIMFIGWAVYQITVGHSYYALAFDFVAASCYLMLAYMKRQRELRMKK